MTRINVVPVQELENIHLLAEYRELPRIFGLATRFYHSTQRNDKTLPKEYTLGKGHVKFFYNKLFWLAQRQKNLVHELIKRGYNIQFTSPEDLLKNCPSEWCNDYIVTNEALKINRERIALRLHEYKEKIKNKSLKKNNL